MGSKLQQILLDLDVSVENARRRHSLPSVLSSSRSVAVGPRDPKTGPVPSGPRQVLTALTEEKRKKKKKTRKRKRRRKKKSGAEEVPLPREESSQPRCAPCVLLGDSMVGKETGRLFTGLSAENQFRSLPGAGVDRVRQEIGKLDLDRNSTLVLSVGGNDLFRRDGRPGSPDKLLDDFSSLLTTAKRRVNRCIVVGLIPRRYATVEQNRRACDVNKRLATLCRSLSLRYVDVWKRYFSRNEYYHADGIHFTAAGAREFVSLIGQKLFKPATRVRPKTAGAVVRPPARGVDGSAKKRLTRFNERTIKGTGSSLTVTRPVAASMSRSTQTATNDTAKRQRSILSGGSPSPDQQPPKRRRDSGEGSMNGDSPSPGNESPSEDRTGP